MPRLLIATGNPGKAREFRALFAHSPFEVVDGVAAGWSLPEVPETGETFAANAERKAVETSRLLPPEHRDTLLVLDYVGEGFFNVWDGEEVREVEAFWWPRPGAAAADTLGSLRQEWWTHATTPGGASGWFTPDSLPAIDGADACA